MTATSRRRRVSGGGAGRGQHARSADAGRVLGWPRSAGAPGAGPVSEPGGAPAAGPGARTGPRAPAPRVAARRTPPGERVARSRGEPGDDARPAARRAWVPRARALQSADGAARGRAWRDRAGQRAGHHRAVSQLAAQAARWSWSAGPATSASRLCAPRSLRSAHLGRRNAKPAARRCQGPASHGRPTGCSCTAASASSDATELVPYLAALGVSHVYCSPYLRARPGSTHGYDIVDHNALNPEIGSARGVRALRAGAPGPWHGTDHRPRAQPHGRHGRRQPLVDRRARERPGVGLRRLLRHRLGAGRSGAAGQGAGAGAGRSLRPRARARRAQARLRAGRRRLRVALLRASLSGRPARVSAHPRARAASAAGAGGRRHRARRLREPDQRFRAPAAARRDRARAVDRAQPRQGGAQAPARGPVPRRVPPWPRRSTTPCTPSTARRRTRAASTRCTSCSRRRPTGWPTGAWPPTRSTTGASSTSTTSRRCAWRTRRCSTRPTASCSSWSPSGKVDGLRIDHPDGLYDPAQYFQRLQDRIGLHRAPGARSRATAARCRSTSWSRRSRAGHERVPESLGGARHHRLPLRQRRQRAVRGHRDAQPARPHLPRVHRRGGHRSKRWSTRPSA